MSTLPDVRRSYRLSPTQHPTTYVGGFLTGPINLSPAAQALRRVDHWRIITGDDCEDYAPTGPTYASRAEAFANVPAAVRSFYGES